MNGENTFFFMNNEIEVEIITQEQERLHKEKFLKVIFPTIDLICYKQELNCF